MKHAKKNNQKALRITLISIIVVLLAAIIFMLTIGKTGEQGQSQEPTAQPTAGSTAESTEAASQPTDQTEATEAPVPAETEAPSSEDVQISTPYATLVYPGDWEALLRTEINETDGYRVEFHADLESGKTQQLFSLTFGGSGSSPIGAVTASDGAKVNVYLDTAVFSPDDTWTDSEINIVYSMQEGLNHVLDHLPLEQVQDTPQATQPSGSDAQAPAEAPGDMQDMALDTPYGELHFPSRWAENLVTEVDETNGYSVSFYGQFGSHEKQLLFIVHFGGDQGAFFGEAKDVSGNNVEVRLSVFELSLDSTWTSDENSQIFAMQEDLNYLLERLG